MREELSPLVIYRRKKDKLAVSNCCKSIDWGECQIKKYPKIPCSAGILPGNERGRALFKTFNYHCFRKISNIILAIIPIETEKTKACLIE